MTIKSFTSYVEMNPNVSGRASFGVIDKMEKKLKEFDEIWNKLI